jgi:hypothetical protein
MTLLTFKGSEEMESVKNGGIKSQLPPFSIDLIGQIQKDNCRESQRFV